MVLKAFLFKSRFKFDLNFKFLLNNYAFFVGRNPSADVAKLLFDHGVEYNETVNKTSLKERGVTPLQLPCEHW